MTILIHDLSDILFSLFEASRLIINENFALIVGII